MAQILFKPEYPDFLAAAIKYNGNIKILAEHFSVSRETMHQFLKRDPNGKEIIDQVRCYNKETMLDLAEHVIRFNVSNYQNDPHLAQRAAEKVIDKLGYLRGWLSDKTMEEEVKSTLSQIVEELKNGEITQHKTDSKQDVEVEQPLPDNQ